MHEDLDRRVAAIAHDCWCAQMAADGWRAGPFNAHAMTHDAMRPFDELGPRDAATALLCARSERLARTLASAIDYPRGPDRPFFLDEMCQGRPVAQAHDPAARGAIIDWEETDGDLTAISVRWDDGTEADYDPWLQALARPEELD